MMSLYVIASLEGWPDIMYQAIDSSEVDKGPILNNNPVTALYFVLFILIGSFFFMNFFIGVLFLNFKAA